MSKYQNPPMWEAVVMDTFPGCRGETCVGGFGTWDAALDHADRMRAEAIACGIPAENLTASARVS